MGYVKALETGAVWWTKVSIFKNGPPLSQKATQRMEMVAYSIKEIWQKQVLVISLEKEKKSFISNLQQ